MATAQQVARFIIRFFQEAGDPVSNLKLQKLLYYVQGWHLALNDAPAFEDRLEAWIHGPVQPGVYGSYKQYRWNPIVEEVEAPSLDAGLTELIKEVIEAYGLESGYELEVRTHGELPWIQARGDLPPDVESNNLLSQTTMKNFFNQLKNESNQ